MVSLAAIIRVMTTLTEVINPLANDNRAVETVKQRKKKVRAHFSYLRCAFGRTSEGGHVRSHIVHLAKEAISELPFFSPAW